MAGLSWWLLFLFPLFVKGGHHIEISYQDEVSPAWQPCFMKDVKFIESIVFQVIRLDLNMQISYQWVDNHMFWPNDIDLTVTSLERCSKIGGSLQKLTNLCVNCWNQTRYLADCLELWVCLFPGKQSMAIAQDARLPRYVPWNFQHPRDCKKRQTCQTCPSGWWFQTFGLFSISHMGYIWIYNPSPLTNLYMFQDGYCTTSQPDIFSCLFR